MLARWLRWYLLFQMVLGAVLATAVAPQGQPVLLVVGLGALLWPVTVQGLVIAVIGVSLVRKA